MATLLSLPDELLLEILALALPSSPSFTVPTLRIAATPHSTSSIHLTAISHRLRSLAWHHLRTTTSFSIDAPTLNSLLHRLNRATTFPSITTLTIQPEDWRYFLSPASSSKTPPSHSASQPQHNAAAFRTFPSLKRVRIDLKQDYKNTYLWRAPTPKNGESKSEAFVRHMVRRTVGRGLQDLIGFLHHPRRGVGCWIEGVCTRDGKVECKVEIRDNVVVVKEEGCKFASKALWEEGWRKVLCWGRRWRSEKRRNLGCSCWRELLSGWT